MTDNRSTPPVAPGKSAKHDVTLSLSSPRARARAARVAPDPHPEDRIRSGPHKGKRPSEAAMELAAGPRKAAMELAAEHRRTVELAQEKIERDLRAGAGRLVNRREQLAKQRAALERAVALAVSSHPERPDWYDHPGPLPRERVQAAAGLNGVALHRLMERYRKTTAKPSRRPR